ncbi:homeobox protein BEL1 homolog [Hibiscus syriacus]|uniref:homeobox protein BEL1 homolog n=1 Tax=Hibiscus syriacus TaxID=106335 RepID=UPI001922D15C|nr:homeobox protein BEL1 homolog [Hibiscus syriacus]
MTTFVLTCVPIGIQLVHQCQSETVEANGGRDVFGRNKEHDNNMVSPNGATDVNQNDKKPTPDQLVRVESECLSSVISTNLDKIDAKTTENQHGLHHHHQQQHDFSTYGAMDLDISSYSHQTAAGGVSLTLGLQQHGGNG